jgi:hypothetical protein
MANFLVTHFKQSGGRERKWVPLSLVTRLEGCTKHYFLEFETSRPVSKEVIAKAVELGYLITLPPITIIGEEHNLWLDPEGNIYLARKEDPANDPQKILVLSKFGRTHFKNTHH